MVHRCAFTCESFSPDERGEDQGFVGALEETGNWDEVNGQDGMMGEKKGIIEGDEEGKCEGEGI